MRWLLDHINIWVILGALIVAAVLVAISIAAIIFMPPAQATALTSATPQTGVTVIPGPTPTPTPPAIPPTATPKPTAAAVGGIAVGMYVKITGTEGSGLRLRSDAGTSKTLNFVAMDEEVFQVKDGPRDADGFTWWMLQAPYDPKRTGWGASKYLTVVQGPAPTTTKAP